MAAAAVALLIPALTPAGAFAQQYQPDQPDQPPPAAAAPAGPTGDTAPEVTVEQAPADVQVEQNAPDVTIRQGAPAVEIEQERPDISIRRAEPQVQMAPGGAAGQAEIRRTPPDVRINQAKPIITIDQGEPEVVVEPVEGEPQITIERLGRDEARLRDMGISDTRALIGMALVDREGEEIGTVDDVLMGNQGSIDSVVVGIAQGILGQAEKPVALPWSDIRIDQENQRLQVSRGEDEVSDMPAFDYTSLADRQPLVGQTTGESE
jgi:sporulation protein YlmC with PRC-barrel domain